MHYIHIDKHTVAVRHVMVRLCMVGLKKKGGKESNKVYGNDNSGSTKENYMRQNLLMTGQGGVGC